MAFVATQLALSRMFSACVTPNLLLSCPDNLALLALTNEPVCPIIFKVEVMYSYLRIATFLISMSSILSVQ